MEGRNLFSDGFSDWGFWTLPIKINYKNRQKENDEFGRTEERFLKWSSNCVWWSPGVFDTPPLQPAAMNTDANREYRGAHIGTEWSITDTDPPSNSIQLTCIGVCHQAWLGNTFHLSSETNPFVQSICLVWCHNYFYINYFACEHKFGGDMSAHHQLSRALFNAQHKLGRTENK